MKYFEDLVRIKEDNEFCTIIEFKWPPKGGPTSVLDAFRLDMIGLGCLDGDEELIRATKGSMRTYTVFSSGKKPYSWEHGDLGYTIVGESTNALRKMVDKYLSNYR